MLADCHFVTPMLHWTFFFLHLGTPFAPPASVELFRLVWTWAQWKSVSGHTNNKPCHSWRSCGMFRVCMNFLVLQGCVVLRWKKRKGETITPLPQMFHETRMFPYEQIWPPVCHGITELLTFTVQRYKLEVRWGCSPGEASAVAEPSAGLGALVWSGLGVVVGGSGGTGRTRTQSRTLLTERRRSLADWTGHARSAGTGSDNLR